MSLCRERKKAKAQELAAQVQQLSSKAASLKAAQDKQAQLKVRKLICWEYMHPSMAGLNIFFQPPPGTYTCNISDCTDLLLFGSCAKQSLLYSPKEIELHQGCGVLHVMMRICAA